MLYSDEDRTFNASLSYTLCIVFLDFRTPSIDKPQVKLVTQQYFSLSTVQNYRKINIKKSVQNRG